MHAAPSCRRAERLLRQGMKDEISALGHTDLGQDRHLVAEGRIELEQTLILGYGRIETVASLGVGNIDFGPRRRKKYLVMITMRSPQGCQRRLTCQVLKGGSGIEQALSKNTHPAARSAAARSPRAISTARRAKAILSTHGSAKPSPSISSLTILRPGSSTVA